MENYLGCKDNQTTEQKAKNYKLEEICAAITHVEWVEKTNWASYPLRNQNGSLTCVCQTLATEMGIIAKQKYNEWIDFSASFPYQQRGGDYGGCSSSDIYSVFPRIGNVSESLMPSQNMHEAEVLAVKRDSWYSDLAKAFSMSRIELPVDFETVASTIQATGKGVMVWFHIGSNEWNSEPVFNGSSVQSNHSVTAIDFGLKNGKKYLLIMDSSGQCNRLISEEYFKNRCFLASYLKNFNTLEVTEDTARPSFDGSVKSLQEILIYEGFLAVGLNTGFFGNLTKTALAKFQAYVKIVPAQGVFGPITKSYLYKTYA